MHDKQRDFANDISEIMEWVCDDFRETTVRFETNYTRQYYDSQRISRKGRYDFVTSLTRKTLRFRDNFRKINGSRYTMAKIQGDSISNATRGDLVAFATIPRN